MSTWFQWTSERTFFWLRCWERSVFKKIHLLHRCRAQGLDEPAPQQATSLFLSKHMCSSICIVQPLQLDFVGFGKHKCWATVALLKHRRLQDRREEAGMCLHLQNTNYRISIMSKLDTITAHYTLFNRDIIIELYCVYTAHCYQTNHSWRLCCCNVFWECALQPQLELMDFNFT